MAQDKLSIGFLGFGNMARAMAQGLVERGGFPAQNISACAAHFDKLQQNTASLGVKPMREAQQVVEASQMLIVAVKPHLVKAVLTPLREALASKVVISVAAGCSYDFYQSILSPTTHHLSTIPNTPIAVGTGVIACEERHSLTEQEYRRFKEVFEGIALIETVEGKLLSTASSLAGCGPAFAAMFLEALGDAGVKHGLSRETAYRLAAKMIIGTATLLLETHEHPGQLKDAVCSPGGSTIKGVASLESDGFRGAIIHAIDATNQSGS